jgi:hypothetical protein
MKALKFQLFFNKIGVHELSALFVKHKSITLIGCSTSKCIIKYETVSSFKKFNISYPNVI